MPLPLLRFPLAQVPKSWASTRIQIGGDSKTGGERQLWPALTWGRVAEDKVCSFLKINSGRPPLVFLFQAVPITPFRRIGPYVVVKSFFPLFAQSLFARVASVVIQTRAHYSLFLLFLLLPFLSLLAFNFAPRLIKRS